jgi:uncharacterized protein (DUF58 family)
MAVSELLTPAAAARARQLEFFARTTVEAFMKGQNRSSLKGVSPEFMQHRMYMPGDDLRMLDWRILARTDRLVTREQQEFTTLDALVVLDSSGSMGYGRGDVSKLEFARRCAAMLAYLLVQQNDRCGLAVFGTRLTRYLPPGGGRKHLAELFRRLLEAGAQGETDVAACAGQLLRQLSRRSVLMVFSDGFQAPEPLIRGLSMLSLRGHEVLFFQTYDPSETDLDFVGFTQFLDLETQTVDAADPMEIRQAYREVFQTHQQQLRDGLLRAGVQFYPLPVCTAWDATLADILRKRQH